MPSPSPAAASARAMMPGDGMVSGVGLRKNMGGRPPASSPCTPLLSSVRTWARTDRCRSLIWRSMACVATGLPKPSMPVDGSSLPFTSTRQDFTCWLALGAGQRRRACTTSKAGWP